MRKLWNGILLFVFTALFFAAPVAAEDDDDLEVRGSISAIDESSITVNGKEYALTGGTEYEDDNDNSVSRSFFTTGMYVKVKYVISGLSRFAEEVELESEDDSDDDSDDDSGGDSDDDDDLRLKGFIESISSSLIVVAGKDFTLTQQTKYEDDNDGSLTNADFSAGDYVKVEYFLAGTTRVASKVELESEDDDSDDDSRERGKVREGSRYTKVDDSNDSTFRGRTTWRARVRKNKAEGRLESKLMVKIPSTAPDFADMEAARNAALTLTLLRNNLAYAICYYEFNQSETKPAGLWAQFRIDGRFKDRPNKSSRTRFNKGSCDTDLLTEGVQAGVPDIRSGDTFLVGDAAGDYLEGSL